MVLLYIVFVLIIIVLGVIYFLAKKTDEAHKLDTHEKEEEEEKKSKTERKHSRSKPEKEVHVPPPVEPSVPAPQVKHENVVAQKSVLLNKIAGFTSEVVDMNILYDRNQKLSMAAAEVHIHINIIDSQINSSCFNSTHPLSLRSDMLTRQEAMLLQ